MCRKNTCLLQRYNSSSSIYKYSPPGHIINEDRGIVYNEQLWWQSPEISNSHAIQLEKELQVIDGLMDAFENYARKWFKCEPDNQNWTLYLNRLMLSCHTLRSAFQIYNVKWAQWFLPFREAVWRVFITLFMQTYAVVHG